MKSITIAMTPPPATFHPPMQMTIILNDPHMEHAAERTNQAARSKLFCLSGGIALGIIIYYIIWRNWNPLNQ